MAATNQVSIKAAGENDVALLLELIRELADYEKVAHEVVATPDDLRRTLFGERAYAEAVIARVGDEPVGFALFFHTYSTFLGQPGLYLEDLYVRPAFRRRGLGLELLQRLARIARDRDCGRIEWWVLDWNESAIRFYERLGAEAMREWTTFRLTGNALRELARADGPGKLN